MIQIASSLMNMKRQERTASNCALLFLWKVLRPPAHLPIQSAGLSRQTEKTLRRTIGVILVAHIALIEPLTLRATRPILKSSAATFFMNISLIEPYTLAY